MNKLLITLIVLPLITYGQTQQGAIMTNGSVSFSFSNVQEEVNDDSRDIGSLTTVDFNPSVGYFFIDGVAAGVGIDWQRSGFKDNDNDRLISHSISLSPFARYYSELGPFFHGQFSVGGGINKFNPEDGPVEEISNFSLFGISLGLGYPYFPHEHISIEPLVLFRSQNNKTEDENAAGIVEETVKYRGLLIQVGFTYYIF